MKDTKNFDFVVDGLKSEKSSANPNLMKEQDDGENAQRE